MWNKPLECMKGANMYTYPDIKGCNLVMTAVRQAWKLSFSKECVITQLPNKIALKIDGAQVYMFENLFV